MAAVQVHLVIGTVGKIRHHDSSPGTVHNRRTVGKIRQHASSPGTVPNRHCWKNKTACQYQVQLAIGTVGKIRQHDSSSGTARNRHCWKNKTA